MQHPQIVYPLEYVPSISPGQKFGADRSAFGGTTHKGIDLAGPTKSKVKGGLKGAPVLTSSFCGGNTLRIDAGNVLGDGNYWSLRYVHLHSYTPEAAKKIAAAGAIVALTDNTGQCTTGDHLHYEVIVNGIPINPASVHPELGGSAGVEVIFTLPTWETIVTFWEPGKTSGQALFNFVVTGGHLEHIASEHIYAPATETSLATLMNRHLLAHYGQPNNQDVVTMENYLKFWHPGQNKAHAVWDWSLAGHFTHLCEFLHPDLAYWHAQAKEYDNHLRRHFGVPDNTIWILAG